MIVTKHSAITDGRQDDPEPQPVSFEGGGFDEVATDADGASPDDAAARSDEADTPNNNSAARNLVDWIVVIGVALLVAILIRTFVMAHFRVEGTSMLDTVHPGDRVFVNKLSYRFGDPKRGDVVVLHELQGERDLIKRVIALPGETVEIQDCQVLIDGEVHPEPYLSESVRADERWCNEDPVTVPDGSLFVMGDNRPASADSRYFGPIPETDVVGRAFVIFWPITDASGL